MFQVSYLSTLDWQHSGDIGLGDKIAMGPRTIGLIGIVGVFAPWIYARKDDYRKALLFALLPSILICLALISFLTLDSWLNRTFTS